MKWKMRTSIDGKTEIIYVQNRKYIARMKITENIIRHVNIIKRGTLFYDREYNPITTLNEIETLIIISKEIISSFKNKIELLESDPNCKNDYSKELIEFKQYFIELERSNNEMDNI